MRRGGGKGGGAEEAPPWRSPRAHLYLVAAAIVFTVWAVELEAFNVAASEAACPWPGRDRTTSRWSSSSTDDDVHILVMADPQILGTHAYPSLPPLLQGLPPWLADHYIRKAYRALMRKATSNGSERIDAVVWLGDLTDEGRRVQDDADWHADHDHFDRLFPRPPRRRIAATAPPEQDGRLVLRPRPEEIPALYAVGNHDIPIPREPKEASNIESDKRAKARFTERYGNKVLLEGRNRFAAFDSAAAVAIRPKLTPSFNVRVPVMTNGTLSHELVLLDAMDLVGMQRDHFANDEDRVAPKIGPPEQATLQQQFPETYAFVSSLSKENTTTALPRVVISHVPLWRVLPSQAEGVDRCTIPERSARHGVRREHPGGGLRQDFDRMDTYQNLLGPTISTWLKEKVAWTGGAIFSGDDHDHCEFVHSMQPPLATTVVQDFDPEALPELTLKSMSITMSVRKPGFARITLFPPRANDVAMAYTPCLLPDRIGMSIWAYALLTAFGLGVLAFTHKARPRTVKHEYELLGRAAPRAHLDAQRRPTGLAQALRDLLLLLAVFAVVFYVAVALM